MKIVAFCTVSVVYHLKDSLRSAIPYLYSVGETAFIGSRNQVDVEFSISFLEVRPPVSEFRSCVPEA